MTTPRTRRSRIPASEAKPGARYKSKLGRTIVVYEKPNKKWREAQPDEGWVPYRAPGQKRAKDPGRRIQIYGWIPPDYPLLPLD